MDIFIKALKTTHCGVLSWRHELKIFANTLIMGSLPYLPKQKLLIAVNTQIEQSLVCPMTGFM